MGLRFFITLLLLSSLNTALSQLASNLPVIGGNSINARGDFAGNAKLLTLISALDKAPKSSVYGNVELSDIEGSMFYEPDFVIGSIYLNGEQHAIFPMRYNALNDEFEVKVNNNDSKVQALAKTESVSCKKGDEFFVFKQYLSGNDGLKSGYFIALTTEGKYRLYEKRAKIFKEGSDAKTSFHKSTPHRFLDKIDFFISKEGNNPVHLKTSKKGLLSFLDKKDAQQLKQFLKNKKKLDFSKKNELMGIIAHINAQ